MTSRQVLHIGLAAILLAGGTANAAQQSMTVYKTPTCGCCAKWAEHMRASGFRVRVQDVDSTAEYQNKYGVPQRLASCHTARIAGYTVEGHVPAADVVRLLKARPKASGIAVPGMPMGSPGMEGPRTEPYSVLLFDAKGRTRMFNSYPGK